MHTRCLRIPRLTRRPHYLLTVYLCVRPYLKDFSLSWLVESSAVLTAGA
jgi:hypothetical protein